jgi:hypothetical protein
LPSLVEAVGKIGGNRVPLTETTNLILLSLRDGVAFGIHLAAEYGRQAGLGELELLNRSGKLPKEKESMFTECQQMAAAVAVYCTARYALWRLSGHREDEARSIDLPAVTKPEVVLSTPVASLRDLVCHLSGLADSAAGELRLLRSFERALEDAAGTIVSRSADLPRRETFEQAAYQLEGADLVIDGFEMPGKSVGQVVEINEVEFEQIVGNKEAKHAGIRIAMFLALYDVIAGRNPICDVGGFPWIRMGFGPPGTGKSMLIQAIGTLIKRYCERRGIPFDYAPMPNNIISTFQGGTAERAEAWMKRFKNKKAIVYATIDDGENNLEDRTRQSVSAGVRELIGVFLRETEGASAQNLGNVLVDIFTNLPEQVDPAIFSRVRQRFEIAGAQTFEDFADQGYGWQRKLADLFPAELNGLDAINGYSLMSAQQGGTRLADVVGRYEEPREKATKEAYFAAKTLAKGGRGSELALVALMYTEFKKHIKGFSSRDVRNIQEIVSVRFTDFDVEDTWFDNPGEFFEKVYPERVGILRELARKNCGSLSFGQVLIEESLRYLDTRAQVGDIQFGRDVEAGVQREMVLREIARRTSR